MNLNKIFLTIYTYEDYKKIVEPADNKIILLSSEFETLRNIKVGDEKNKIIKEYGEPEFVNKARNKYYYKNNAIIFILNDKNIITRIDYKIL